MTTSGQRLKKALKTAALLPARAVMGSSSFSRARQAFTPAQGETPIVILRLQVVGCTGLMSKDRNGFADPFVVVSLFHSRRSTPTCKRTLNPTFPARESTFDFPIYLSVVERMGGVGVIELVVWYRDTLLKKEHLGEVGVGVDSWFGGHDGDGRSETGTKTGLAWDDVENKPFELALESTRANIPQTGSVRVKLGFVAPAGTTSLMDFKEVFRELRKREGRASWVSAPPTKGVGTIRSHHVLGAAYEDDGGLSSSDEYEPEEEGSEVEGEGELADEERGDREGHVESAAPATPPPGVIIVSPTTPTPTSAGGPETPSTAKMMPPSLAKALAPPPPPGPASPEPLAAAKSIFPVVSPLPVKSTSGFMQKMKFAGRKTPTPTVVVDTSSMSPSLSPTSSSISTTPGAEGSSTSETNADGGVDKVKKKRVFRKRWNTGSTNSGSASAMTRDATNESENGGPPPAHTPVATKKGDYMFEADNDIVGIVMLEIIKAEDLPKLKNMTRMGWDMDPFVVISSGKKVFRTRVLRHNLNPVWDEKVLFHVRRYETGFQVLLTILDWDKLSSNDHVGDASFEVKSLIDMAPQPDPTTGLYAPDYGGDHPMKEMKLELTMAKDIPWALTKGVTPAITIRAKYQPYAAMRQRFWRQYLTQYDTDDTGAISQLELTSMLDSLGSTLTRSTIENFFVRYGKNSEEDELTMDEAIQCLETELCRPLSEKKRLDMSEQGQHMNGSSSVSATPVWSVVDKLGQELHMALEELDFSGRPAHPHSEEQILANYPRYTTEPNQMPLSAQSGDSEEEEESGTSSSSSGPGGSSFTSPGASSATSRAATDSEVVQKKSRFGRMRKKKTKPTSGSSSPGTPAAGAGTSSSSEVQVERVINVKNCPLCHRPRLNSKAEMDIVTHLAVCASQDWNQVDRIVVGNFVTASQAQRKWYTNILGKISAGGYRLGANSANIIVQNRTTGQLEEEKMQVYVRLGIRLLYKGATGRMEGSKARGLLKSLSIKQGRKYDSPESAKEIPSFIHFHQLNVDEILDPIDSFKTFNQFFYRKLKPDARPVERPDDPYRLVSGADCRLMTFETVSEATKFWIKGREFTVGRLLGDNYKDEVEKYTDGALGIFRLAPQDYHRFHSPVDGTIGRMTYISGEYYTVNPQAIRTSLDVYGDNVRKIVPIDSPQFGRVMAVCIGAMMVGTIKTTVEEGQQVQRGQEFGYFAFGGSTIVLLFEKGVLEWDEDLLVNGRAPLETLVRVGMGVGRGRRPAAT